MISINISFLDNVEYTSIDADRNVFMIYYKDDDEMLCYELPLNFIDEITYTDGKNECPICGSKNIIKYNPQIDTIIDEVINDEYDPNRWECLNCGTNKFDRTYDKLQHSKEYHICDILKGYDEKSGYGKLSYLQIRGEKYLNQLHWFKIPRRLLKLLGNKFKTDPPKFRWTEKNQFLYLEYLWYLDEKDRPVPKNLDLTRVCNDRYMRPPKKFNRDFLKYKYPNLWTKIDADFKWIVTDDCVEFKIWWDLKKYELKGLQENL